jgi:hypothetical protein
LASKDAHPERFSPHHAFAFLAVRLALQAHLTFRIHSAFAVQEAECQVGGFSGTQKNFKNINYKFIGYLTILI